MRKMVLLHLIVIAIVCPSLVSGQQSDEWITTIDEQFTNVTFYCNSSLQTGSPYNISEPELWMLPDLTNIPLNYNDGHVIVSDNGWRLDVIEATVEDFGVYHCMMKTTETDEWYLVKLGLNIRGPYFEDLWEKYEMNTILGLSAMGAFLVVSGFVILIYTLRFVPSEDEEAKPYSDDTPIDAFGVKPINGYQKQVSDSAIYNGGTTYDNIAYDNDVTTTYGNSLQEDDTYL